MALSFVGGSIINIEAFLRKPSLSTIWVLPIMLTGLLTTILFVILYILSIRVSDIEECLREEKRCGIE